MSAALASVCSKSLANDYDYIASTAKLIKDKLGLTESYPIGIICGSGLGAIADAIEDPKYLAYGEIPGFPTASIQGHKGRFVFGTFQSRNVVCLQGRVHPYEGYSLAQCSLPIRIIKQLGVEILISTSAVGAINSNFKIGDVVLVRDHIFLAGFSLQGPLVGSNDDRLGPRFPSMNNVYDKTLRTLALECASQVSQRLIEGVYAMVGGPHFETSAELRLLELAGTDIVGMSVCHEVVVARHSNMRVLCFSIVTNMTKEDAVAEGDKDLVQDVFNVANQKAGDLKVLIERILTQL